VSEKLNSFLFLFVFLTACSSTPELPDPRRATVDGYEFRYVVRGKARPVVVFESGFAAPMNNWSRVFSEIGVDATAFAYNRRGYAEMEGADGDENSVVTDLALTAGTLALDAVAPGAGTAVGIAATVYETRAKTGETEADAVRTAKTVAEDLRALLHQTGMRPPYILVGHSLGGLYSLYFAKTYPREVAGLVLVDSTHPLQAERCREKLGAEKCEGPWLIRTALKLLPDAVYGEWTGRRATGRQVMDAGPFPPIPLVVLTRGKNVSQGGSSFNPFTAGEWLEMQRELEALSPRSRHIVAEKSGHFIQKDEPEVVIQAVRDVVDQVRAGALAADGQ
jgi:pimeloyl-ACP methyl ester carboxylesterase